MSIRKSQAGFSVIEILLVVVVVGIIGGIGYVFLSSSSAKRTPVTESRGQQTDRGPKQSIPAAPAIEKTEDLDKASATLDQIDPSTNTTELDSKLNTF